MRTYSRRRAGVFVSGNLGLEQNRACPVTVLLEYLNQQPPTHLLPSFGASIASPQFLFAIGLMMFMVYYGYHQVGGHRSRGSRVLIEFECRR